MNSVPVQIADAVVKRIKDRCQDGYGQGKPIDVERVWTIARNVEELTRIKISVVVVNQSNTARVTRGGGFPQVATIHIAIQQRQRTDGPLDRKWVDDLDYLREQLIGDLYDGDLEGFPSATVDSDSTDVILDFGLLRSDRVYSSISEVSIVLFGE